MKATVEQLADWFDRHMAKPSLLPCRVDEMTEREAAIFKIAAHHLGFIQFVRSTLPDLPETTMNPDGSATLRLDPTDALLGPFEGARIPPGKFMEFMEHMMVHRDVTATIEFSPPINFLEDGVKMPTDDIFRSTDKQKD